MKKEQLTEGQRATQKKHKPTWWMWIWVWVLCRKIRAKRAWERVRSWLVIPVGEKWKLRWRIQVLMARRVPIPVYRDPAIVNHVKSLSRKDVERLAIVQATHLKAYLDFYGKTLVDLLAVDGTEMTKTGLAEWKNRNSAEKGE